METLDGIRPDQYAEDLQRPLAFRKCSVLSAYPRNASSSFSPRHFVWGVRGLFGCCFVFLLLLSFYVFTALSRVCVSHRNSLIEMVLEWEKTRESEGGRDGKKGGIKKDPCSPISPFKSGPRAAPHRTSISGSAHSRRPHYVFAFFCSIIFREHLYPQLPAVNLSVLHNHPDASKCKALGCHK